MVRELRSRRPSDGGGGGTDTSDSGVGSSTDECWPAAGDAATLGGGSRPGEHFRITVCANQGGRKYMEDRVHVHCERDAGTGRLLWSYFAVYDGHGGSQAAEFARRHLMENIVGRDEFTKAKCDRDVLAAIERGFLATHEQMNEVVDTWPRTASGYRSTAGTTASVAIVMRGKLYVGHVGDSAVVLGERRPAPTTVSGGHYVGRLLTAEHKPEAAEERQRIERSGGEVMQKANVMRVVWHRNHGGADGPPSPMSGEKIPFLAVARSLGDLWSYSHSSGEYVVSPRPDTHCVELEAGTHVCMVLASDGLTNVMRPQHMVDVVNAHEWAETAVRCRTGAPEDQNRLHSNHARWLVRHALRSWSFMRADNITAMAVIFDRAPPAATTAANSLGGRRASPYSELWSQRMDVDGQLELHPECMVRAGPAGAERLATAPLQLYYAGAVDSPDGGPPVRAHELSPSSLDRCITYRGPGFAAYAAEHPTNPYTASGSPVKPRIYPAAAFCRPPAEDAPPLSPPTSENRQPSVAPAVAKSASGPAPSSSAPALRLAADMLNAAAAADCDDAGAGDDDRLDSSEEIGVGEELEEEVGDGFGVVHVLHCMLLF